MARWTLFAIGMSAGMSAGLLAQAERPIVKPRPPAEDCEWIYQKARYWAMNAENGGNERGADGKVKLTLLDGKGAARTSLAYSQLYLSCRERNR